MLIYIPAERQGRVPCFLGMNFRGNTATTFDPEVTFHPYTRFPDPSPWWDDIRVVDEKDRGSKAYRWNFETVIKAGFASATFCLCDVFTDHPTGYSDSIMPMFYSEEEYNSDRRKSAAISAWAWGLMRGIDALESLDCIDKNKIIVHGHSRMGKAAIWAGVNDPRIAMTVSSGSGAAGAKISRRYFGENMEWLDQWRKYWFVPGFEKYCGKDTVMPFDQHQLMALIAPRKLFVTSSNNDGYADPVGEFLATKTASAAWGKDGIAPDTPMPAPGNGVGENSCRYYIREGEHDFTLEQWQDLLKFASVHFL
jgi:hypothetical protein